MEQVIITFFFDEYDGEMQFFQQGNNLYNAYAEQVQDTHLIITRDDIGSELCAIITNANELIYALNQIIDITMNYILDGVDTDELRYYIELLENNPELYDYVIGVFLN